MATDSGEGRKRKFSRQQIAAVSEALRFLAGEVEGFSQALEKEEFVGELEIDGGQRMYDSLEWMATWLERLRGERMKLKLPTGKEAGAVNGDEKKGKAKR